MVLALALIGTSHATEIGTTRTLGLGVVLGTATGVSGHAYLGGRGFGLDFGVGFTNGAGVFDAYFGQVSLHRHFASIATSDGVVASWRLGLGGFVTSRNAEVDGGPGFGVRLPVGIDLDLQRAPVQFGLEVSPVSLLVAPAVRFGLDAGLVVRYYL